MFGKRKYIAQRPEEGRKGKVLYSFIKKIVVSLILLTFLLGGGFFYFLSLVPLTEPTNSPKADGVVVLTGAAKRIKKAATLVAVTEAKRLLISGVNSATKSGEIEELKNISHEYKNCCIDLDYQAKNTIDNAKETALWAKKNEMKSLVVVTSNYHMPRSIREMKLVSPHIKFIPYPVIDKKVQIEKWWEYPGTRRLLMREYFKYILSLGRMALVKIGVKASLLTTEPHLN